MCWLAPLASRTIGCAESTPKPGTSASRITASWLAVCPRIAEHKATSTRVHICGCLYLIDLLDVDVEPHLRLPAHQTPDDDERNDACCHASASRETDRTRATRARDHESRNHHSHSLSHFGLRMWSARALAADRARPAPQPGRSPVSSRSIPGPCLGREWLSACRSR